MSNFKSINRALIVHNNLDYINKVKTLLYSININTMIDIEFYPDQAFKKITGELRFNPKYYDLIISDYHIFTPKYIKALDLHYPEAGIYDHIALTCENRFEEDAKNLFVKPICLKTRFHPEEKFQEKLDAISCF
tara:strand:+ start:46607 stop:47008 length:402 start_codon:yes stop_codon:yes gene_type:complete